MSSSDFLKTNILEKLFQEYHQCQTVRIQIRPDILSGLIWIQTVCKGYQQTALVGEELIDGPRREKICLRGFANNKGAEQLAHPHRLISAFVICFLESIVSKLATSKISIF